MRAILSAAATTSDSIQHVHIIACTPKTHTVAIVSSSSVLVVSIRIIIVVIAAPVRGQWSYLDRNNRHSKT